MPADFVKGTTFGIALMSDNLFMLFESDRALFLYISLSATAASG
jgi:hypothetical protein